ncbi:MAG TPA: hypothetical protein VEA80_00695 [Vitreimonas sp.]|uniref:hypothetical protein n=1 Tax=Vitreimonas sp. TaxID=3069702 RepID=UPI002D4F1F46|nr:hypothetical protein [Vitreimonas sp.]HYD85968.1 hypothetical protein [Vitreimonas sp.]
MRAGAAFAKHLVVSLALLLAGACATTSVTVGEQAGALRAGAGAARAHAANAFSAANQIARENAIERKLDLAEPPTRQRSLSEDDFPRAVAIDDAAKWDRAFAELDAYFVALQSLVDPERARMTGDGVTTLLNQLRGEPVQAEMPAGVGAAFATLAQALVQARAEREATAVLRRVDPAFNELMTAMADAIGEDDVSDLRGTVSVNWSNRLSELRSDYASAANRSARQTVIARFLAAADARDAQLAQLAQLRAALLALGEAHSAAARGSRGDMMFWMNRVDAWVSDFERRRQTLAAGAGG